MAVDAAAALGGPVMAQAAVQETGNTGGTNNQSSTTITPPPSNMSGVAAWAMGMGLGSALTNSLLEQHPELASSDEDKKNLSSLMTSMMDQMTKSMAKSTDFLKEWGDDEEKCAATAIYAQ